MQRTGTIWLIALALASAYLPALAQWAPPAPPPKFGGVAAEPVSRSDPTAPAVQMCEIKTMIAYGTAREAIVRHLDRRYWNAQQTSEYQLSILDELYRRIDQAGFKDFLMFGAEQFHACMEPGVQQDLPRLETTARCVARADIVMYVRQYKAGGGGPAGTKRFARNYLKDPVRYPQKSIDAITDAVFPIPNNDRLSELRQQYFHDCEFGR